MGQHDEQLFKALAWMAEQRLDKFSGQDFANTAWAFATVGQQDEQLFNRMNRMNGLPSQLLRPRRPLWPLHFPLLALRRNFVVRRCICSKYVLVVTYVAAPRYFYVGSHSRRYLSCLLGS